MRSCGETFSLGEEVERGLRARRRQAIVSALDVRDVRPPDAEMRAERRLREAMPLAVRADRPSDLG